MSARLRQAGEALSGPMAGAIAAFIRGQINEDGGFRGRAPRSDLYYTIYGLDCAAALDIDWPRERVAGFIDRHDEGADLDYVHLVCLARCLARYSSPSPARRQAVLTELISFRCADHGFSRIRGHAQSNVYDTFLAFLAFQDLGEVFSDGERIAHCLQPCRTPDGGFANYPGLESGTTPVTAAATVLQIHLGLPVDATTGDWLLARCQQPGGFEATAGAPMPDLLSTATALHALSLLQRPLAPIREACLDFVLGLWREDGGFSGTAVDSVTDCEYTFHALLALGNLVEK
jgi:prenyltransferase beta subunit